MNKNVNMSTVGILSLYFLLLQGCYTQLAIDRRIVAEEQVIYQTPAIQWESVPETIDETEIPSTIIEQHYWIVDPYNQPFAYYPSFDGVRFYYSFHLVSDDPWSPWYYRPYRPYCPNYYYSGWNYYDPFGYDAFWYATYSPWYYSGHHSGYWYPSVYTADTVPDKKRDWDRRGSNLTGTTIDRPSNSSAGSDNWVGVVQSGETSTESINRNENIIVRTISQNEIKTDDRKMVIYGRDEHKNKPKTVKRVHRIVKRSIESGKKIQKKTHGSKKSTVTRKTKSNSNNSSGSSVRTTRTKSNTRSHSKSSGSHSRNSGHSRERSSKRSSR